VWPDDEPLLNNQVLIPFARILAGKDAGNSHSPKARRATLSCEAIRLGERPMIHGVGLLVTTTAFVGTDFH
jgi:hypothetical protein